MISSLTRDMISLWDVLSIPVHIFPNGQGTCHGALEAISQVRTDSVYKPIIWRLKITFKNFPFVT